MKPVFILLASFMFSFSLLGKTPLKSHVSGAYSDKANVIHLGHNRVFEFKDHSWWCEASVSDKEGKKIYMFEMIDANEEKVLTFTRATTSEAIVNQEIYIEYLNVDSGGTLECIFELF